MIEERKKQYCLSTTVQIGHEQKVTISKCISKHRTQKHEELKITLKLPGSPSQPRIRIQKSQYLAWGNIPGECAGKGYNNGRAFSKGSPIGMWTISYGPLGMTGKAGEGELIMDRDKAGEWGATPGGPYISTLGMPDHPCAEWSISNPFWPTVIDAVFCRGTMELPSGKKWKPGAWWYTGNGKGLVRGTGRAKESDEFAAKDCGFPAAMIAASIFMGSSGGWAASRDTAANLTSSHALLAMSKVSQLWLSTSGSSLA